MATPLAIRHDDDRAQELAEAIRGGDATRLKVMLAAAPDLATCVLVDDKGAGRSLLHVATDWPGHFPNCRETIALLAQAGADPDAGLADSPVDAFERPLHWAASADDVEAIDALLDNGANIEASGAVFTGGTPMSDAVVFAQWCAAERLLSRGAVTTLWQAAALGLYERVRELAESAPKDDLTSALWHACRGGQPTTAELLLDRGADINWVGFMDWTPLRAAKESGNKGLVAALKKRGAK